MIYWLVRKKRKILCTASKTSVAWFCLWSAGWPSLLHSAGTLQPASGVKPDVWATCCHSTCLPHWYDTIDGDSDILQEIPSLISWIISVLSFFPSTGNNTGTALRSEIDGWIDRSFHKLPFALTRRHLPITNRPSHTLVTAAFSVLPKKHWDVDWWSQGSKPPIPQLKDAVDLTHPLLI